MMILGINNRIADATVTSNASSWESTLPLANIQTPRLLEKAKTADLSFTITADLSSKPARAIGCVAIAGHNLTRTATVQIVTKQNSTQKDDSGTLSPWPMLPSTDPHWTTHTYSAAVVDTDRIAKLTPTLVYFLPSNYAANKVEITITDSANTAIEIGRVFIGEAIQPVNSVEWGDSQLSLTDNGTIQQTAALSRYRYAQPITRQMNISFKHLSQGEAFGALLAAQQAAGLFDDVVVAEGIPTYTDISGVKVADSYWFQSAFLGHFAQFDGLSHPYLAGYALNLAINEVVA